jgi:hypothetical protein
MKLALAIGTAALLTLTACGTETGSNDSAGDDPTATHTPTPSAGPIPTDVPAPTGKVTASGTVMDRGRPELCVGGVLDSYPPQCGGPPIKGWDWEAVNKADFTRVADIRWGEFVVVGTYDGTSFTLDRATTPDPSLAPDDPNLDQFRTRCEEPEGGWQVLDPAKSDGQAVEAVFAKASQLDGYAGAWMDQSRNTSTAEEDQNDPRLVTVNVGVTGNVETAEETLREIWGGALCVFQARHTEAKLLAIGERLQELPGMSSSSSSVDRIDVSVIWDDGSLQGWADEKYGDGLVRIHSEIQPVG